LRHPDRGDIAEYVLGGRRIRVLIVSADAYTGRYPMIALVHDRADGDVPGLLFPLPAAAGAGTVDISRTRFADPSALGAPLAPVPPALMARIDAGLRRLFGL
jgi:hypothetical protein